MTFLIFDQSRTLAKDARKVRIGCTCFVLDNLTKQIDSLTDSIYKHSFPAPDHPVRGGSGRSLFEPQELHSEPAYWLYLVQVLSHA